MRRNRTSGAGRTSGTGRQAGRQAESEATDEAAFQERAADLLGLPREARMLCSQCHGAGQVCVCCGRPEKQCDCEEMIAGGERVRLFDPVECGECGGSGNGGGA